MYFGKKILIPEAVAIIPKSTSATLTLTRNLAAWGSDPQSGGDRERDARRVVSESLPRREDRAVTAALFSTATAGSTHPEAAIGIIRRQISIEYTKHFMESLNSDICTGIRGIEFFDVCASKYPSFDIPILREIADTIGLGNLIQSDWNHFRNFWESNLQSSSSGENIREFQSQIELFGLTLANMFAINSSNDKWSFRLWVTQAIGRLNSQFSFSELDIKTDFLPVAASRMENIIGMFSNNIVFCQAKSAAREKMEGGFSYRYLLVCATEIERQSIVEKVKEIGNSITPHYGGGRAYYDLGFIQGSRIALVKVAMGSATVGGSISTTLRILTHLSPAYVIMVGIAFGMDEKEQAIGTVLVGRQVLGYEQQRIGTTDGGDVKLVNRGSRTDASPVLVSLLEAAAGVWNEAPVKVGLMLSGEKLVDNVDFREQLKTISGGEAIGGEMEGIGLVVATAEKPTPWVLVKAICDWADGKKSEQKRDRQSVAARNAVSLVFRALQIGPDEEEK